jgi:hypothetical protein
MDIGAFEWDAGTSIEEFGAPFPHIIYLQKYMLLMK